MPSHTHIADHPAARWLIFFVVAAGVYFFHMFLIPVLGALIIAFASWPLYERQLQRCHGKTWQAASIATFLVVLLVVVPLIVLAMYSLRELRYLASWLMAANRIGASAPMWVEQLPWVGAYLAGYWNTYLGEPGSIGEIMQMIGLGRMAEISRAFLGLSRYIFSVLLSLLFMLITLFFLYKDGRDLVRQVDRVGERILPQRWYRISRVAPIMISATVVGMSVIAVGEGIVLGVAYWIAGAPAPLTLGIATGFMALIPGGAPLAMSLVSLYLVGSGHPLAGLGLFAWGTFELFVVDKTIRPHLVGGPAKLPFLPTLLGLVGGVSTMGLVGLFVGPVVMALLVALWREWVQEEDAPPPGSTAAPPNVGEDAPVHNP